MRLEHVYRPSASAGGCLLFPQATLGCVGALKVSLSISRSATGLSSQHGVLDHSRLVLQHSGVVKLDATRGPRAVKAKCAILSIIRCPTVSELQLLVACHCCGTTALMISSRRRSEICTFDLLEILDIWGSDRDTLSTHDLLIERAMLLLQ